VSGKNIEEGIFLYNFQPAIGRCVGITSAEDPDRLLVFLDDDPQCEVRGISKIFGLSATVRRRWRRQRPLGVTFIHTSPRATSG
jgi:hypothetical protein